MCLCSITEVVFIDDPLTDDGHCSRGLGSDKGVDGRVLKFPSTSPNELRVTLYDPLRGVPVVELEVIKSKEK
ncbi:hypothetical protein MetMK1DRAFT_00001800 [Metallosphaera yellowstonensis MK1]|uniref:Uncharacterized protein n=1 Tax=Metallosphaera yellowstonensis MK1 TaxID=671065 RepID=H2C3T5_9CREN|nr:hypothetical protein MetMK1DRAFT_00001800 [Metallosphaera yellowstonensis MK1]